MLSWCAAKHVHDRPEPQPAHVAWRAFDFAPLIAEVRGHRFTEISAEFSGEQFEEGPEHAIV